MKMIAIGTIHGHKLIREANPSDPKSKAKYKDELIGPGKEFDTDDLGISDDEANDMIERKVAKRKTREVTDDSDGVKQTSLKLQSADAIDKLTDDELKALAADRKVTIKANASRSDIIAALKKA